MSDLHSLAILVGLSKEYEEGLASLEEAELKIKDSLERIQRILGRAPKYEFTDHPDPDAAYYQKYKPYIDSLIDLGEALSLLNKFTKGVLKYE